VTLSRSSAFGVITSMERESELQLVSRLRTGDPDAFDAVHHAFNARLYNFLVRLSNERDVAEDLLEDTWLRLVKHARRLRPDTRLGPWLFTVARHLHANYRRSRLLEDSHAAGLLGMWPDARPGPSPLEAVEASETGRRLAMALASLPLAYREALLLVAVEGLRHSDAAEICGVTTEAMRQRVSRARALLTCRLTEAEMPILASLKEIAT
jgi:RNA polymerase sigma-70 factor, ECF subfamily